MSAAVTGEGVVYTAAAYINTPYIILSGTAVCHDREVTESEMRCIKRTGEIFLGLFLTLKTYEVSCVQTECADTSVACGFSFGLSCTQSKKQRLLL